MPANILVRHMSLGASAKKISHTCMPYLPKELAVRSYHYICLFLSALPHVFRWTTQPATKAQQKGKQGVCWCSWIFHNVNRNNFGTFDNPRCDCTAGARAMQLSAWAASGCKSEMSLGGWWEVPQQVAVFLLPALAFKQPSALPPQKDDNLMRWQNANYPGRVCVAVLYWVKNKQTNTQAHLLNLNCCKWLKSWPMVTEVN